MASHEHSRHWRGNKSWRPLRISSISFSKATFLPVFSVEGLALDCPLLRT